MRHILQSIWCIAQAAMLLVSVGACALAAPPVQPTNGMVISLYPKSDVAGREVQISDVARVETSNVALKSRIESLDLMDAPPLGESATISARTIGFRLRMAGVDAQSFTIKGSQSEITTTGNSRRVRDDQVEPARAISSVPVASLKSDSLAAAAKIVAPASTKRSQVTEQIGGPDQLVEDAIVAAAQKVVLDQLPWPAEDVSFRLAQPLSRDAKLFNNGEKYTCVAELRTNGPPVGRVNVDVTVKSDRQAPLEIPVSLDVRHFETVVATARPIARGRTIQKEDLYLHRWDVTSATDYSTQVDQLIGRTALRTLSAAQIIRDQDLDKGIAAPANGDRSVQIKRSDRVKILARLGQLAVTVNGEAMQDGRLGDTIRVRNTESKSIVQGKVISPDEVEITY